MIKITWKRSFLFILVGFIVLNSNCFIITTDKYNKFVEAVPKNEHGLRFIVKEDGYMYSVKKPDYLHYTGNLAVANNEKGELLIILASSGHKAFPHAMQARGIKHFPTLWGQTLRQDRAYKC